MNRKPFPCPTGSLDLTRREAIEKFWNFFPKQAGDSLPPEGHSPFSKDIIVEYL